MTENNAKRTSSYGFSKYFKNMRSIEQYNKLRTT